MGEIVPVRYCVLDFFLEPNGDLGLFVIKLGLSLADREERIGDLQKAKM